VTGREVRRVVWLQQALGDRIAAGCKVQRRGGFSPSPCEEREIIISSATARDGRELRNMRRGRTPVVRVRRQ
jgi:hypothetical protein